MKTISVPTRDQVSPDSQLLFDVLQKRMGKVPNLYATIGYSPFALQSFMNLEETLNKGVFNPKEREAIALIVSEINSCEYCLAGHTMAAIKRGFTKEETIAIRKGSAEDPRLHAIIQLSKSIAENKGKPSENSLEAFYNAGFDEAALMELIGFVTVRIFTNYVFALTNVPIDFPLAEPLH
ncbi:MAG: carboxymuconolactone decarboxylase family protein [Bacteroidota bacterium]|nr:carboxymuconolactone decarboxylase family protein [Bacteroidota bacterium]